MQPRGAECTTVWSGGSRCARFALLLRETLVPLFGERNPNHTVWMAVVFSFWYCGVRPSVVSALLSLAGVWFRFDYLLRKREKAASI